MKLNLDKKLIILLVSVILLIIVSIAIAINIVFKEKFNIYISKNNEREIEILATSIEDEYKKNEWNLTGINQIGINAISNGRYIKIYDYKDNLIWSALESNKDLCHTMMNKIENNMESVYPNKNKYTEHKPDSNSNLKNKTLDLKDENGEYIGYVDIEYYGSLYYMDEDVDFLNQINKVIMKIAFITTMITVVIAVIISNNVSKPIEVVADMANSIGKGGYTSRIDYDSNIIEIDNLIKSINNLAFKLEEQEKLRKRLTTDISHELRTPLTSIQTHLEALIDGIWEPSTERLNSVNEEVIRLTSLVNQLKNLAKFDSEKSKLSLSEVNLENLIKNIVYNNQGKALEKNINIKFELEKIITYLDREKISQLIVNLLSNAIRYTNNNGNIYLNLYKKDDYIKIHVKDDGIGIPKDSLNYIFERFYRVDESRSKNTGGIGVGLTIVKSIVDLHNGKIEVKSEVNKGSEFIVTLPIIDKIN